jgi:hypothetical protein
MLSALSFALLLGPLAPAAPPADVTARLDAAVEAKWKALNLFPEAPCDDAVFLRRAYLDLAGRVPPALAAREFLNDSRPDKRARLVDALLAGEDFADHWARVWTQDLTGRRPIKQDSHDGRVLHHYLKEALAANRPYRQVVAELICGEGLSDASGPVNFLLRYNARPTDLAGAVSKQFLGITLQCAQCHDHPHAAWKKGDFWGMAAFFGRTRRLDSQDQDGAYSAVLEARRGELLVDDTSAKRDEQGNYPKKKIVPRLPGQTGGPVEGKRRQALAAWVTGDKNPFFARNRVNRVWAQLFGMPLVRSLERSVAEGEGAHVQILDLLAEDFAGSGYDVKRLVRVIVLSRAYQLGGAEKPTGPDDPAEAERRLRQVQNLARFPVRTLSPDQLYQAVVQVTGYRVPEPADAQKPDQEGDDEEAGDPAVDQLGERALTVQRALAVLNGGYVHKAVQSGARATLAVHGPRVGAAHVEWLFLATLSRRPTAEESAAMRDLLKTSKGARGLEDVLWALINSTEFNTNH